MRHPPLTGGMDKLRDLTRFPRRKLRLLERRDIRLRNAILPLSPYPGSTRFWFKTSTALAVNAQSFTRDIQYLVNPRSNFTPDPSIGASFSLLNNPIDFRD